jgi:hypothetical protein
MGFLGYLIVGIKLAVAELVIAIVSVLFQVAILGAVAGSLEADSLEGVIAGDASMGGAAMIVLGLIVFLALFIVALQGFIVNKLWGWS